MHQDRSAPEPLGDSLHVTVRMAYALQASERYRRFKHRIHDLLENNANPYKKALDAMMILLIFISVVILIREVKNHVADGWLFFNNYVISMIFLTEYLLRLWVHGSASACIIEQYERDLFVQRPFRLFRALGAIVREKLNYMRQPVAIVDLMAIVPFFHEMRLLRIFIIFRVFKLFRYTKSLRQLLSILSSKRFELLTLLIFASIVVFVSGVMIYIMEANNPDSRINTLYEALYWSVVTISTVGYGDFVPATNEGRAVAMVVIITGIAVLSFSTSIVVSAFTEQMDEVVRTKTIQDARALSEFYLLCGYSEIGVLVARRLRARGRKVVVIDRDEDAVRRAKEQGLIALRGDPGSLESYKALKIDFARQVLCVLCLDESDIANVSTALTLRAMHKGVRILSVLEHEANRKRLKLAGIHEVLYAQEMVGLVAGEFGGKPVAFEAIHALSSEQSEVVTDEITLDEHVARRLGSIDALHVKPFRIVLLGVYDLQGRRFHFNPPKGFALQGGHILIVMGIAHLIREFKADLHLR